MLNLINNIGEVVMKIPLTESSGEISISTKQLPEGYYYVMIASTHNRFSIGKTVVVY